MRAPWLLVLARACARKAAKPHRLRLRCFARRSALHDLRTLCTLFTPLPVVADAYCSVACFSRLLSANCEHFAVWCKTGESISLQVLAFRGALSRFGALAAGVLAGTAVLARLEAAERTTTRVEHHTGSGLTGALGLSRRKIVIQETVVQAEKVLAGGALIGAASTLAFGAVSRLQASLFAARRYRLAVRLCGPDGRAAGCHAVDVVVVKRGVVKRGPEALRQHLIKAMGAPGSEMRAWVQEKGAFVPLTSSTDELPRCTSLTFCLAV